MNDRPGADARLPKLLERSGIKLRLGIACLVILIAGAALAPPSRTTGVTAPQEHAAPLLEEQVQLREAPRPFAGMQDVAERVSSYSVTIHAREEHRSRSENDFAHSKRQSRPAGFAIVLSDTHLLTHAAALDGRSTASITTSDDRTSEASVVAYDPATGLALLTPAPTGASPAPLSTAPPAPGALAVAVGRWNGSTVAVPSFITRVDGDGYRIGAVDGAVLPGMPIYDPDGALVAIAAGSDGTAYPVADAARPLSARASAGERLTSIGVAMQPLAGALTSVFGDTGALIAHVVESGPAGEAGVEAGDVLVAIDSVAIDTSAAAMRTLRSLPPGSAVALRLRRRDRHVDVNVTPMLAYEVAALARGSHEPGDAAGEARTVFPQAVLDRAGIPRTARVLALSGRPGPSRADAQRVLRATKRPVPVLLQHEGERFFAVVEPSR
jgi:S1-C subfamily serine protease